MKDSRKKLLQMVYDCDQLTGEPLQINSDGSDTDSDSGTLRNDVNYLKSHGYIFEPLSILCSYTLSLTEKGEQFVENGFKIQPNTPANTIFNIENATNSVIGTQANVTLNINEKIHEARKQIDSSNSSDKEELHQIINILETAMNNQIPVKKGLLSRFSTVIQNNAWIASPIMSIFLEWLTSLPM